MSDEETDEKTQVNIFLRQYISLEQFLLNKLEKR